MKELTLTPKYGIIVLILSLTVLNSNLSYSQTIGNPAGFGINGEFYSGTYSTLSDDWFKGLTGLGMIDESQTAANLAITESSSNTPFIARQAYSQYSNVNGYLLYDAIYARDYITMSPANNDLTSFDGGDENGQNPSEWESIAFGVGDAVDIVDAYAHLRREGITVGESLWLNMAVSTLDNNGSHFVDFELFAEPIEVSGGSFINLGSEEGHSAWQFGAIDINGKYPITLSGDLVAGFEFNGATVSNVEVRIWTARANWGTDGTDGLVPTPLGFTWGPEFDGADNGSVYGYAQIVIPAGGSYSTGSLSSVTGPPWKTFQKGSPIVVSEDYPAGGFAEVAVDLSALGIDPSLKTGNACDAPFTKILIKSRSSAAFTSQLKDFAGPYAFLGTPIIPTDIKISDPRYFTCTVDQLTLSPLTAYTGNNYYDWSTTDGEFLDGSQAFTGENAVITKPGTYRLTAAPIEGCTETYSEIIIYAEPCAIDDNMGEVVESGTIIDTVTYNVLDNSDNTTDYDLDDANSTLTLTEYSSPSNGTITIDATHGEITYTPNPGFFGTDTFEYQICDNTPYYNPFGEVITSGPLCDIALVTVTVLEDVDDDGVGNIYDIDNDNDGIPDSIENTYNYNYKEFDLCGVTSAIFTYDYSHNLTDADQIDIEISNDGGTTWTLIKSYTALDPLTGSETFDVSAYESCANTTLIRFNAIGTTEIENISITNATITSEECNITVRDEFSAVSYSNNNGTTNWETDWLELNDNNIVGTGNVQISTNYLRFNVAGSGAYREADLSEAATAVLTFDFESIDNGNDYFIVEVSSNGGANYTLLEEILPIGPLGTPTLRNISKTYSLEDYVSLTADIVVRFRVSVGYANVNGQMTAVDNVQINYCVGTNYDDLSFSSSDLDGDGIPNYLDLDSDNDGIPDVLEAGLTDGNNDGLVDGVVSGSTPIYGINGLADNVEVIADGVETGVLINPVRNTDGAYDIAPGMYDFLDVDSDNDGLTDTKEAFSNNTLYNDVANDGEIDGFVDTDNNGWHDTIDAEGTFPIVINSDSDPYPNYLDLDSDGDGLPDTFEANFQVLDGERDGIVGSGIPADSDFDGLADTNDPDFVGNFLNENFNADRDGDGVNNYMDIDSDNDGIIDNTEGQGTNVYEKPKNQDFDGDGIDDAYDINRPQGIGIGYTNTDGGSAPDYVDLDSDNDAFGVLWDIRENFVDNTLDADIYDLDNDGMIDPALFVDTDGDGLADVFDLVDGILEDDNATNGGQTPQSQPDDDPKNKLGDRDWRERWFQDTDYDYLPDYQDLDDDNDGILDITEQGGDADGDGIPLYYDFDDNDINVGLVDGYFDPASDLDNDGIPNHLDYDSDGDGITDIVESGGVSFDGTCNPLPIPLDADGNGTPGTGLLENFASGDVDIDGVPTAVCGGLDVVDTDGDLVPDFLDLDSDNDGIYDVLEAGGVDEDGDGLYGSGATNDSDADGLADALDLVYFEVTYIDIDPDDDIIEYTVVAISLGGTPLVIPDTDGDGHVNYLDLDSDNDTIPDNVEGQSTLGYIAVTGLDTDGDGLDDAYDFHDGGTPIVPEDTDGDGIPDYLDLNSDNDGLFDIEEARDLLNAAADTDADPDGMTNNPVGANGLDDTYDNGDTYVDPNGLLDDTQEDNFIDADGDVFKGGDVDYRDDTFIDFDEDGIPDAIDLDDDNDGILDTVEANNSLTDPLFDTDRDGISDYLDPDFCKLNSFGICVDYDVDSDGIPNFYDLDSDSDGCNDDIEAYNNTLIDENLDGIYGPLPTVVDAEGLVIAAGVTNSVYDTLPVDSGGSSVTDFLDDDTYDACKADLSLTKEALDSLDAPLTEIAIGETIYFKITLTNRGPFETGGVQVLDLMPEGILDITYNATQGTYNINTGIWDVGTLDYVGTPNTVILTISGTIGSNCGPITNIAEIISSDRLDPDSETGNGN